MSYDLEIKIKRDDVTPALKTLRLKLKALGAIKRSVGAACTRLTQNHINALPKNKHGWPSTGFWQGAAKGTTWDSTSNGVLISIDNAAKPGAFRYQFKGGTIRMKDKLLTIPAGPQFYGEKATDFTGLRFANLGGHKALIVGKDGAGKVNIDTGKYTSKAKYRGIGKAKARLGLIVAYWLKESVSKPANPAVIPDGQKYIDTAIQAVIDLVESLTTPGKGKGGKRV